MHIHHTNHTLKRLSPMEQDIAVAVVLWLMLAGFVLLMANAWALEYITA